ncbi:MAG: DNA replication and repair protein RecF [Acidobacteriota bacterium]
MELVELSVSGFRNLEQGPFRFSHRTNLILGPNGAGKTSLLEAIVVLGNLRSFRSATLRPAVAHGDTVLRIEGKVVVGDGTRRLFMELTIGPPLARSLRVNGATTRVDKYLLYFPVFAITGPDRELVRGGPHHRRAMLDRFVFLQQPTFFEQLHRYRRVLAQRNAALSAGVRSAELDAWDKQLAQAAATIVVARRTGAEALSKSFAEVYEALAGDRATGVEVSYRGEQWLAPGESPEKVEQLYQQRYNETRERDRRAGYTGDGPHRHDVSLRAAGRAIRNISSSGQSKMVAAALRLATLAQIEKETQQRFPVVVDEIDAELDREALRHLFEYLEGDRQLFLSSTDEKLMIEGGSGQRRIWLENGRCRHQEAASDE